MAKIAIIGGGPAGLMAAEILAQAGQSVTVYERKPTFGRKLQMAGRGGLNLTHSEDLETFLTRYGTAQAWLEPAIRAFPPAALRAWCEDLGEKTFVGTSGRVFPTSMKAAPLLRAWLERLRSLGVTLQTHSDWQGYSDDGQLRFENGRLVTADYVFLALGGASWPRLGSDAAWVPWLRARGVDITPFKPANCGFLVNWSDHFKTRFAGQPLKAIALVHQGKRVQGDVMLTTSGIEGGAVYALSAGLREAILRDGHARLHLDLRPSLSTADVQRKLARGQGSQSLSTYLKSTLKLSPAAIGLLRECVPQAEIMAHLKTVPLTLTATTGLDRAISSAGGITTSSITTDFMLKAIPKTYVAGEMLDWEAPTGGYLLQATFSTAIAAANALLRQLKD